MADEQKGVTLPIIAADELLLQKLILLGGKRACQSLRRVRDVLATDEAGELRKLFGPSQFGEQGTQSDEAVDIGGSGERRHLGAQAGHPAEEVRIPSQLLEGVHLGVSGAEIAEKVADGPTVVTMAFQAESGAERIDGVVEDGGQRMEERRVSAAVHEESLGRGRTCCATARVYCR